MFLFACWTGIPFTVDGTLSYIYEMQSLVDGAILYNLFKIEDLDINLCKDLLDIPNK